MTWAVFAPVELVLDDLNSTIGVAVPVTGGLASVQVDVPIDVSGPLEFWASLIT